jgi:hypothetical protein
MANSYLPQDDPGKKTWLQNFSTNLGTYATTLGVSTGTVTSVQNDAAFFDFVLTSNEAYRTDLESRTRYKDLLRDGKTDNPIGGYPVAPTIGTAPTAVDAGIFVRIGKLVNTIKNSAGYTTAIGESLGIVASKTPVDPNTMKPRLKVRAAEEGRPEVVWTKGRSSGIYLEVDRGTGTFEFLAVDHSPNYTDTHALPVPGRTEQWKYRGIYIINDKRVGQWSDTVAFTVTGV